MKSSSSRAPARRGRFRRGASACGRVVGNFGWPIILKQLRTDFRRNLFFITHLISLCVVAAALLILIGLNSSEPDVTAPQIGQGCFYHFFIVQFLVVLLIFPLFTSTAFSDERSNLSLDLLLITTLRPSEIVWGKFLAASGHCMIYLLATVPLMAISFLFGGITLSDVIIAYAVLIGMALLLSIFSLCISSRLTANVWSTVVVYLFIVVVTLLVVFLLWKPIDESLEQNPNRTIIAALLQHLEVQSSASWRFLAVLGLDVFAAFSYLFLFTTNSVRPAADDRSSKLRLLTFVYLPLRLLLPADEPSLWFLFTALFLVVLLFPTEDANVSRRNRRRFGGLPLALSFVRILAPGPFTGLLYSFLVVALVCAFPLLVLEDVHSAVAIEGLQYGDLLIFPLYLAAVAAVGFLLAACSFTPLYARLTVTFLVIISVLLPMIVYIAEVKDEWVKPLFTLSPWVLYRLLTQEQGTPALDQIDPDLWGVPVVDIAKLVYAGIALGCIGFGAWVARRAGYPLWRYAQ